MNKTSTILVVEDDSAVRNLISTTLQAHNYKYLLASNGETAILEAYYFVGSWLARYRWH